MATRKTSSTSSRAVPSEYASSMTITKEGVRALLVSGLLNGFTPGIANRMVDRFGVRTLDMVAEHHPEAMSLLGDRAPLATTSLVEVRDDWGLLAWMFEKGANPGFAKRAMLFRLDPDNPGSKTPGGYADEVRRNPYLLTQASGIGFNQADYFALRVGFVPDGDARLLACAQNAVQNACDAAGGGARRGKVMGELQKLVGANGAVPASRVGPLSKRSFDLAIERKVLKEGRDEAGEVVVFSDAFFQAEERCALKLLQMSEEPSPYWGMDMAAALEKAQDEVKLTLKDAQRTAIDVLIRGRVAIIAGKPGAGKTTLLRCVAPFLETGGRQVLYAAPTGKAAKRMNQAMNRKATTVHRMLGLGKRNLLDLKETQEKIKGAAAIVLDEASMVDVKLLSHVLAAMGPKTLLLLVGDPGQLPSVGPGKALADLIDSRAFPTAMLTEVLRQAGDSAIVSVARSIDEGVVPEFRLTTSSTPEQKAADCLFLDAPDSTTVGPRMVNLLRSAQAKGIDPLREAQVIAATHKGPAGVAALNQVLQAAFNPARPGVAEQRVDKKVGGVDQSFVLRVGDKVMQTSNDPLKVLYPAIPSTTIAEPGLIVAPSSSAASSSTGPAKDPAHPLIEVKPVTIVEEETGIYNGDVGFLERIDGNDTLWVKFDDGYAEFSSDEASKGLTLSYANTVHKFQGSESRLILFSLPDLNAPGLCTRNLVYTAITRAKQKCLVIGSHATLVRAVHTDALAQRTTRLKGLLNGSIEPENLPDNLRGIYERKALRHTVAQIETAQVVEAIAAGVSEEQAQAPKARSRRRL